MAKDKILQIGNRQVPYKIKSYRRSRTMRLIMQRDGSVLATKPVWVTNGEVEQFIRAKLPWIEKHLAQVTSYKLQGTNDGKPDDKQYKVYRERARELITQRLEHFNQLYGFRYNRVAIRNQHTCWGSCSAKKNLNFNYKLLFLPEELRDYVVVHELCHLKELNHSERFWAQVARAVPDYLDLRKRLHKASRELRVD